MTAPLNDWLATPLGQRLYRLECRLVTETVAQVFGWQLLQIGVWGDEAGLIAEARTQRKSVLARSSGASVAIHSRADALPIASDSVDAVLLPHTLEYEPEPHGILREVERILPGEGHLIVLGFRPLSPWGIRHAASRQGFPPGLQRLIGERRLRDWLKLLGFEVVEARRYLFTLPWGGESPRGQHLLEAAGESISPFVAGAYLLKARKRVYCKTPIRLSWRQRARVVGGLLEPTRRDEGQDVA
jgi:SAM-dependent methyltransferase